MGFEEKSFDESDYAKEVAEFLGTNHHTQIIKPSDVLELIPHIGEMLDAERTCKAIGSVYVIGIRSLECIAIE